MTTLITIALVAYLAGCYGIALFGLFRRWYDGDDLTLSDTIWLLVVPGWMLVVLTNLAILWFATTRVPKLIERWADLSILRGRRGARVWRQLRD
jgi:hypothetical protein